MTTATSEQRVGPKWAVIVLGSAVAEFGSQEDAADEWADQACEFCWGRVGLGSDACCRIAPVVQP